MIPPLPPNDTPALNDARGLADTWRRLIAAIRAALAPSTGWAADTGTASRATAATYTAPTISNPPTQAEVQAIANALQAVSRGQKAVKDDLIAQGRFTA